MKQDIRIMYIESFVLILLMCVGFISCDSTDFIYVDDYTFRRQLIRLNDGFVEIVLQVDPTKEKGYKSQDTATPWPVLRENRFKGRNEVSNELCQLIANITKHNKRHRGKGWHPTYSTYINLPKKILFFFEGKEYVIVIFDFKNLIIFIEGRKFEITKEESQLLQMKLDKLLSL